MNVPGTFSMISVVIPAYRSAETIEAAIQSALHQTYGDLEVIVIDDGPADGTAERVQACGGRVRYVRQEHAGPGAARNRGVAEARGSYVAFLDADDLWLPHKLEQQLEVVRREPDVDAVQCSAYLVNDALEVVEAKRCRPDQDTYQDVLQLRNLPALCSTLLVRKSYFEAVGGFAVDLTEEVWDLACRLVRHGTFRSVPEFLVLYRQHSGNRSREMGIFVESGFRALERVLSDPTLPPAIRRLESKIWARFYVMLAGGYVRNRQPWESLWWGWRAVIASPTVLSVLVGFPVRRLKRMLLSRKKISFAHMVNACASSS